MTYIQPQGFRFSHPDLKAPVKHQSMFVRVHDKETQWRVIIAYKEGVPFLFGMKSWESGGLELFGMRDGHRYVIVWWPKEPWLDPHVYIDARADEGFVRTTTELSYCEACGKEGCTEEHVPCPACGRSDCEGGGGYNWPCIGMHYTDFL